MKNCFLGFYANKNLGDDLFIKIICERYPNIRFTIFVDSSYKDTFNDIKNLKKKYYNKKLNKTFNFLKAKLKIDIKN
ncbi:MAG TPA: hypothetical protein PLV83_06400, partial [Bacilli bacterium]|nr:hypothetical protein [Bacilli bacterium]